MAFFETVTDIHSPTAKQTLRKRPYGVIEVVERKLVAIHLRPLPKVVSSTEALWAGGWGKKKNRSNRVELFYNQPLGHRNFLALKYLVSTFETRWSSVATALSVLDWVATLKRTDAMVCELSNSRLSPRLMTRYGWEEHLEKSRKKHYIKRFYGEYPAKFLFLEQEKRELKRATASV